MKRSLPILLIICILCAWLAVPAAAAESEAGRAGLRGAQHLFASAPVLDETGGWAVIAAARGGFAVPEGYYVPYLSALREQLRASGGARSASRSTEYSCAVLALTAIGEDPANVDGYDLLKPLGDFDITVSAGVSAAAYALIALDAGDYTVPVNKDAKTQATRELYVDYLLGRQLKDGGWSLGKQTADADVTAIVLQALANYRGNAAVESAAALGVACLSAMQDETGGFSVGTSEACSQTILALCALGIGLDDARFVKNGRTVLDALLTYQLSDGSFKHTDTASDTATVQALLALCAVRRAEMGKSGVFDMSDAVRAIAPLEPQQGLGSSTVVRPHVAFDDVQDHKNQTAIETLARYGIIDGMGKGKFSPDATMTRAQFAKIVVCGLGLAPEYRGTFTDVAETAWYAGYIDTAAAYGIVNGVGHGKFEPEGVITRQEAATMLTRAAKLCGFDTELPAGQTACVLAAYPDGSSVASYAGGATAFCAQYAILPVGEKMLAPSRAILRCEVAQMLYNLLRQTDLLQ